MAACLAQHGHRDAHARSVDQAVVYGRLDAQVGATGIPDRGDPAIQHRCEASGCDVELIGEWSFKTAQRVDAFHHRVDVAVDHSGKDRHTAGIYANIAVQAETGVGDAATVQDHV